MRREITTEKLTSRGLYSEKYAVFLKRVQHCSGLDKTERLYMDVNLAFIDELKGDYQQALDRLKHVTEKAADDDKIERLVQQRYHAVLEKRKRAEQKEKHEKESNH